MLIQLLITKLIAPINNAVYFEDLLFSVLEIRMIFAIMPMGNGIS